MNKSPGINQPLIFALNISLVLQIIWYGYFFKMEIKTDKI